MPYISGICAIHLWCEESGSASPLSQFLTTRALHSQSKISKFGQKPWVSLIGYQNIVWLDVTVHDLQGPENVRTREAAARANVTKAA